MDQQLLNALNNLSNSLEMIADALQKKGESKTTTTNALQNGDFSKQLIEINSSLKSIKKDTEEILSKQNTILELQRSKNNDNIVGNVGEDPKKESQIKKGATMILLIAAAVLAIGLAFKIVGEVDFLSVVSLGLAIVMVADAFSKIAESKITVDQAVIAGKVMVIMSIAILFSSWALAFVYPIGFGQALTAILIAGMFTVISFGVKKIIKGLGEQDLETLAKSILFLPILLPAIALGITLSSWILAFIEPISIFQAFTAILIAGMFTVISFGIAKILSALGKENIATLGKSILFLPILLPAIALGITLSSWVLQMIIPISLGQAFTAILIAGMFTVISFGLGRIINALGKIENSAKAIQSAILMVTILPAMAIAIAVSSLFLAGIVPISLTQFLTAIAIAAVFVVLSFALKFILPVADKINLKTLVTIPLLFTTLAIAIWMSSSVLSQVEPIPLGKLINILMFSVVFAISAVVLGGAAWLLNKMGLENIAMGSIAIVVVATAIMISSLILKEGEYNVYPSLDWAIGVGASIVVFGGAAYLLGLGILSGIGALALAAGSVAVVMVAATIVATSFILGKGTYGNYPSLDWVTGTGLSLTTFGLGMTGLGALILGSFGLGMVALVAGADAVLIIADTIVKTSFILKKGNYNGGPTKSWAEGISLALGAFAPVYKMLSTGGIMKALFGSGPTPEQFSNGIITISKGIVDSAHYFADAKVAFKGGPSKEWSEGVGKAIAAFSPVYAALMDNGFFGSNVSAEDMKSGILTISDGIIAAANKFSKSKAVFDVSKAPSKEWGENVSSSLQAFAPVFEFMKGSGWWKSNKKAVDDMVYGISSVANAIVVVAKRFASVAKSVWNSYPTDKWISGTRSAVEEFIDIGKISAKAKLNELVKVNLISLSMVVAAKTLFSGKRYFNYMIPDGYISDLDRNLNSFIKTNQKVKGVSYFSLLKTNIIAAAMVRTAKTLWGGKQYFNNMIPDGYMDNLSTNVMKYLNLTNSIVAQSKGGFFNTFKNLAGLDPVSQTIKGMIKIAGAYDKLAQSLEKFGNSLQTIDGTKVNLIRRLTGNLAVLAAMDSNALDRMMQTLEERASVFSKLIEVEKERTNRPTVGEIKGKSTAGTTGAAKGSAKMSTNEQLDKIIEILSRIDNSTSTIDEYITSVTDGNIKPTELSSSGNTKGGGSWIDKINPF